MENYVVLNENFGQGIYLFLSLWLPNAVTSFYINNFKFR